MWSWSPTCAKTKKVVVGVGGTVGPIGAITSYATHPTGPLIDRRDDISYTSMDKLLLYIVSSTYSEFLLAFVAKY